MAAISRIIESGFRYPGSTEWLFRGVTLTLEQGSFYCLTGRSGIGKSTLLRVFAGLLPLTEGTLDPVSPENEPGFHSAIMFQDPRLLPWRNAFGNVTFALEGASFPRTSVKTRAERALIEVGLAGLENRYPHELSGGQQQRVALARALVTGARVLFLDEPFSALDHFTKRELIDVLKNLCRKHGVTALMVTHDPHDAELFEAEELSMTEAGVSKRTEIEKAAALG